MQKKHIYIAGLVAFIAASSAYIFWPTETPEVKKVDVADKAAGLLNVMASNAPSSFGILPKWQDPKVMVINGVKVPPVPDPIENNKTLGGIDTDNNGVRDDIDRLIAEKFPDNPALRAGVAKYEGAVRTAIMQPSKKNVFRAMAALACEGSRNKEERQALSEIEHVMTNTVERGRADAQVFAGATGMGCENLKYYTEPRD